MRRIFKLGKGLSGHQCSKPLSSNWRVPNYIVNALGHFSLYFHMDEFWDPGVNRLIGRLFINPPNDRVAYWLRVLASHGNGIALIFARTETKHFFNYVWPFAHSIFFFKGRIRFINGIDGMPGRFTGGAPSCLVAYGELNTIAIKNSKLEGKLVYLK